MDRWLLNYLPPVLREVLEFKAINEANEPEISLLWDAFALVLANQFLDTADQNGVRMWEQELKLHPKDTDTLEERKDRIKALWNMEIPYTVPWLKKWLTGICGPYGHDVVLTDYTLDIQLDHTVLPNAGNLAAEILDMLLTIRPQNIRVLMTAILQSTGGVCIGAVSEREVYTDVWPRLVNNMESSGGITMAGALEYHNTLNIYPREQEENTNAYART